MNNNAILFSFGLFFILIATFQPIIRGEFENIQISHDVDSLESDIGQISITENEVINITGIVKLYQVLLALFFWVIGAPWWINIFIIMMRMIGRAHV